MTTNDKYINENNKKIMEDGDGCYKKNMPVNYHIPPAISIENQNITDNILNLNEQINMDNIDNIENNNQNNSIEITELLNNIKSEISNLKITNQTNDNIIKNADKISEKIISSLNFENINSHELIKIMNILTKDIENININSDIDEK